MSDQVRVGPGGAADVEAAAGVLGEAFTDDPVLATFVGPGPRRAVRLAGFFAAVLRSGPLRDGVVDVARDAEGVVVGAAVWETPGRSMQLRDQVRELPAFLRAAGPRGILRSLRNEVVLARYRPRPPHWYLMAIGVGASARGLGAGTALLQHRLDRVDLVRQAAYLEGSSPRNQALYERLGFVRLGDVEGLPAGARPCAMWRPARPAGV